MVIMATGRKTGGKDFVPGQSGNPAGRPAPAGPELRAAKLKLREQFELIVLELAEVNLTQLQAMVEDPTVPALKLMVASVMLKGLSLGDPARVTFLLDRLVGPVPKAVELGGVNGEPLPPFLQFDSTALTATLIEVQRIIKAKEKNKCTTGLQPGPQQASALPAVSLPRGSRTGS